LSIDWAGGGIVSTTEDLLRFQQALVQHRLIGPETLEVCFRDTGKFGFGMDYGYGILRLNVNKMALLMPKALNLWGNFGSIGAYMFYNPAYDVYIIGSFNHSNARVYQVRFVIDLMRKIRGALEA
jgi:CubicO group peptidase (beta-lactamase class C family)